MDLLRIKRQKQQEGELTMPEVKPAPQAKETANPPRVGRPAADNELNWKQFSTMLPGNLIKELRKTAATEELEIREIIKRALEEYLNFDSSK